MATADLIYPPALFKLDVKAMNNNKSMHALTLCAPEKMEMRDVAAPEVGPRQILIRSGAVGLCGTDFHIYQGHANYNTDDSGRLIPLEQDRKRLAVGRGRADRAAGLRHPLL